MFSVPVPAADTDICRIDTHQEETVLGHRFMRHFLQHPRTSPAYRRIGYVPVDQAEQHPLCRIRIGLDGPGWWVLSIPNTSVFGIHSMWSTVQEALRTPIESFAEETSGIPLWWYSMFLPSGGMMLTQLVSVVVLHSFSSPPRPNGPSCSLHRLFAHMNALLMKWLLLADAQ